MMQHTVKYVEIGTLHGQPVLNKIMGAGKARDFAPEPFIGSQAYTEKMRDDAELFSVVTNRLAKVKTWKEFLSEQSIDHIEG